MDLEERYISSLPSNVLLCEEESMSRRHRINNDRTGQGPLSKEAMAQNHPEVEPGEIIEEHFDIAPIA